MKILFVQSYRENLGFEYLSTFLKNNGHKVDLFLDPQLFNNNSFEIPWLSEKFDFDTFLSDKLKKFRPDFVAFSVFTCDFQWALKKATLVKSCAPDIKIIFGGIHPTLCPEAVIDKPQIDAICIGEGELPLLRYVENSKDPGFDGRIPNLWIKHKDGLIKNEVEFINEDLNKLPFPDKALFYSVDSLGHKKYSIITGKGCVFNCSFCSNNALHSICGDGYPRIRKRDKNHVISELLWAKQEFNIKRVGFVDEIFLYGDKLYAKEFLREYARQIALPFTFTTHCYFISDELCWLLKEAGCEWAQFGIQSVDERYRLDFLHRSEKNSDYVKTAKLLKKYNLTFSVDHIFGMPFEPEGSYEKAVLFYNELRPQILNTFQLQYFPKTDLLNLAVERGLVSGKEAEGISEGIVPRGFNVSIRILGRDIQGGDKYYNYNFWMNLIPLLPQRLFVRLFRRFGSFPSSGNDTIIVLLQFMAKIKNGLGHEMLWRALFHIKGVINFYRMKTRLNKVNI